MPNPFPPCELAQYRRFMASLPPPSDQQIEAFVNFVSEAHSWYKHLPLLPPGIPFRFFLDPSSGCDRVRKPDGRLTWEERTENTPRFHYTWMTTSDYRRRFGYLNYDAEAGTMILVPSGGNMREYAQRPVFACSEGAFRIPTEVAQAGSVPLTGVVHRVADYPWVWQRLLPEQPDGSWPAETGGDATLKRIKEIARHESGQAQLNLLLEPERQRLQKQMREAIRAMLQLVYA